MNKRVFIIVSKLTHSTISGTPKFSDEGKAWRWIEKKGDSRTMTVHEMIVERR